MRYHYSFAFRNGAKKEFEVLLDPVTLALQNPRPLYPDWARLSYAPCEACPLDRAATEFCPIAVNIAGLVESFTDIISYEEADIVVTTEERTIVQHTSVQTGLSSLLGIYMVTSGCPVMDKLRPMVRYHLPFASVEETVYRAAGMYLLAQYFREKKGLTSDWSLDGLARIYQDVKEVNRSLSKRLQNASRKDSSLNALVNLDIFAITIQESTNEAVSSQEHLFAPYLKK